MTKVDVTTAPIQKNSLKEKIKKVLPLFLLIYIIIQPILDTYYLFSDEVLKVFSISPSTVIRFIGIFVILLMTVFAYGFTKKFWALFAYLVVVGIYFIAHYINASSFTLLIPDKSNYSFVTEAMYVLRLTLPMLLIFVVRSMEITKEMFFRAVTIVVFTISGLIVVTNLLCISLDSYTNVRIKANIISWFFDAYQKDSFNGLASKAFFSFANQISVILCMLMPISIYLAVRKASPVHFLAVLLQSIAMLMLGTKTSTFGALLVLGFCFLIYAFFLIIKKVDKKEIRHIVFNIVTLTLIIALTSVILPKAPAIYRNGITTNYINNFDELKGKDKLPQQDKNDPLLKKLNESGIMSVFFIRCYPYQYDREFWEQTVKLDSTYRLSSRYIEESLLKRVKEINNNPIDDLLGMSYCRTSSIYNLERDFLYQYYSMGSLGILVFLGPYVAILLYGIIKCLMNFKRLCNMMTVCTLFGIALALGTSFYCGNSIDALFVSTLLGFVCGSITVFLSEKSKPDETTETDNQETVEVSGVN